MFQTKTPSLAIVALALAAFTWPLFAGDVDLTLEHTADHPWGLDTDLEGDSRLTTAEEDPKTASFIIKRDESLRVYVTDYNPILFLYNTEDKEEPAEGFQEISKFVEALKPLSTTDETSETDSGQPQEASADEQCTVVRVTVDGFDLDPFLEAIKEVGKKDALIREAIEDSLDPNQYEALKSRVDAWDLKTWKENAEKGFRRIAKVTQNALQPVDVVVEGKPAKSGESYVCEDHQLTWKPVSPMATTGDELLLLPEESRELVADWINLVFWRIPSNNLESKVKGALTTLADFQKVLARLGRTTVGDGPIGANPEKKKTRTIKVTKNDTWKGFFTQKVKNHVAKHAGGKDGVSYILITKPYLRLHPRFAASFVYSFVRNPEFKGEAAEDDKLTIVETANDYNKLDISAMLQLIPDKHFGTGIEPFVEVGAIPESDKLAFLLGIGVNLYKQTTLSAGVIYQKVNSLGAGLELGQTIDSLDNLEIDSDFDAGLYVQVGIKIGKSKDSKEKDPKNGGKKP